MLYSAMLPSARRVRARGASHVGKRRTVTLGRSIGTVMSLGQTACANREEEAPRIWRGQCGWLVHFEERRILKPSGCRALGLRPRIFPQWKERRLLRSLLSLLPAELQDFTPGDTLPVDDDELREGHSTLHT